ncbi:MAG: exo-alpha-sialidase [Methanobacteriota archaeon]|nr:MAG: exo-alpha-sialidase [Euryarchaeota archaeon]
MQVAAIVFVALLFLPVLPFTPAARAQDAPPLSPASDPGPHPAFVPFAPNVRVNTVNWGYNYQVEPTMKIDSKGKIYVGWKEAPTHNGGGQRVGFAYSTDGGSTFSPNVLMPLAILPYQSDPWLTVTGSDRVFFTRIEYSNPGVGGGIAVTNTTDGVSWGTTYYYDDSPNFADKESAAHDAAGNLYWVWNTDSTTTGRQDLAFARSNNGGATWTPKVLVGAPGTIGGIVNVAPDGTVLATWWSYVSDDVMFDRSFDGGATWGPDVRVNDLPGSAASPLLSDPPVLPSMAVAPNGTVYVAYEDYRNGYPGGNPNGNMDIFLSRSTDLGATWSPGVRVNDDTTSARQWMPDIAVDPFGGIHLAWEDDRSGAHNIYYANSTDGGATFGPNVRVTTQETALTYNRPGDYLAIESDPDGTVCIVWTDGRGADLDIYFAKLEQGVPLTVATVPAGLNVTVDARTYTAPATFTWRPGTSHNVSAPTPQAIGPQSRRVFTSWSDGGGPTHAVVTGGTPQILTATFATEHEVTVRSAPVPLALLIDGIPVIGSTTQWWRESSLHTIGAPTSQIVSPGRRYAFSGWSDSGAAGHAVTPATPTVYEATFRLQFLLTVSSVHGSPTGSGWYDATVTATFGVATTVPAGTGTRYAFAGWSGNSTNPAANATISMDAPKTVNATWRTEHLLLIVTAVGTAQGAGWYTEGGTASASVPDTVTVNGTVYRFTGWTGASSETSHAITLTMDAPKTLTATWTIVPSGPGPSPIFDVLPLILVAVVIAVVLGLILLVAWRRRRKEDEGTPPPPPSA